METRNCKMCLKEKPEHEFNRKSGSAPYLCADCFREKDRAWQREYHKRPDVIARKKAYRLTQKMINWSKEYRRRPDIKEKQREYKKRWEAEGHGKAYRSIPVIREKRTEKAKTWLIAQSKNVTDSYVKSRIRAKTKGLIKAKEAPIELIELQKNTILLKRTIEQKQHEQHNTTDI